MPLFGGGNRKIKFDARRPPSDLTGYGDYSFVHKFKIRYKSGALQIFENEMSISISSSSAKLPSSELVSRQFHRQLSYRERHSDSLNITNIIYDQSFAMSYGSKKSPSPSTVLPTQIRNSVMSQRVNGSSTISGYIFCQKCGTKLEASSRFCSSCGAPQTR